MGADASKGVSFWTERMKGGGRTIEVGGVAVGGAGLKAGLPALGEIGGLGSSLDGEGEEEDGDRGGNCESHCRKRSVAVVMVIRGGDAVVCDVL